MRKIRCLLLDDEPIAIRIIERHLANFPEMEVVGRFHSAPSAMSFLRKQEVDLIFSDIEMPQMNGLQFLKSLKNPPSLIFTTAYRNYAVEAFDLDVVDYLMKPISFDRFVKAVNKYFEMIPRDFEVQQGTAESACDGYVYIRAGKKIHKILLKDILYIESFKDYVNIHATDRSITARQTLTSIENTLPEDRFMRLHRSYIVSIDHITGFTSTTVDINGKELPIGRNYKQQVFKHLNYLPPEE